MNKIFKEKEFTTLIRCGVGRMGIRDHEDDHLDLTHEYWCPEKVDFKMRGSMSSEEAEFLEIAVRNCN